MMGSVANKTSGSVKTVSVQPNEEDDSMIVGDAVNSCLDWAAVTIFKPLEMWLGDKLFPGMPSHYSLSKKMLVQRTISHSWVVWDIVQVMLTLVGLIVYILDIDPNTYTYKRSIFVCDFVVCQFYVLDLIFHYCYMPNGSFFTDFYIIADVVSIVPDYFGLVIQVHPTIYLLRGLRVLRFIRIARSFKFINNMSGVRRQMVYLVLTLMILVFLSTCVVQFLENYFEGLKSGCIYINANTGWEPSCDPSGPADPICQLSCQTNMCVPLFQYSDVDEQASNVKCTVLTLFDSFYTTIVTLATIGYGDVIVYNSWARAANIVLIIVAVVVIPMRLSELQTLLSLTNPYAKPYTPVNNETHVIVTGHTNEKKKLENFLKEFYHPDRTAKDGNECHTVILSTTPPSEDIRSLLMGHTLESKVTWVLGTPLNVTDLKKVRAETASAIFFLVNGDVTEASARSEDAGNVLCALSVGNFNSSLLSYIQVLRPENGDILADSDVDMILCLDEYKTAVQARNAVCPGFSTFIENLFHSMGSVAPEIEENMPPWYEEYLHGAGMELYFVPLPKPFLKVMRYGFRRICEVIYLQWGCITIGVCVDNKSNVVFNPLSKDLFEFDNLKEFYNQFSVAVIMAEDQHMAEEIARQLMKEDIVVQLAKLAIEEEVACPCNHQHAVHTPVPKPAPQASKVTGAAKFKLAASMVKKTALVSSTAAPKDSRFDIPVKAKASTKLKHMGDAVSVLSKGLLATANAAANKSPAKVEGPSTPKEKRIVSPSETLRRQSGSPSDEGTESDDDQSAGKFSDEDDDSDEDTLDVKQYIGYRKKEGGGVTQAYEGFGLRSASRKTLERNEVEQDASDKSDDSASEKSESEEDDDDAEEDDDLFARENASASPHALTAFLEESVTRLGQPSCVIKDASQLQNHVIVCGSEANFHMFVGELRRPCVVGDTYHPILIVHPERPSSWHYIEEHYNDVYLLEGNPSRPSVLKRMALKRAFSISLMGARNSLSRVDEQVVNTGTLFAFLKMENFLPPHVFATVELTSTSNMAVLNATIMRRTRQAAKNAEAGGDASRAQNTLVVKASTHKPLTESVAHRKPNLESHAESHSGPNAHAHMSVVKGRRAAATFDSENGRFATKRSAHASIIVPQAKAGNIARLGNLGAGPPVTEPPQRNGGGRRASTLGSALNTLTALVDEAKESRVFTMFESAAMEELWDAMDTHHVLPVFAAAKAFVPGSFEGLLVQSYYVKLTPILCEKFVCGQLGQTLSTVPVPKELLGRRFLDIFRLFIANQVLCLGLFRAPQAKLGSNLPYVYVSPPANTILAPGDRAYVFASVANLQRSKLALSSVSKWKSKF